MLDIALLNESFAYTGSQQIATGIGEQGLLVACLDGLGEPVRESDPRGLRANRIVADRFIIWPVVSRNSGSPAHSARPARGSVQQLWD